MERSRAGPQREYNIAVLGAGGVGKSALTAQFVQGIFIERYDPTIEDTYRKQLDVDGRQVMLEIMDTAGTEQFTSIREMYMRYAQGFLIVFSITSPSSLEELFELRQQIANMKQDPNFPIVLVGNKADLEEDRRISKAKAFQISQAWDVPYYETSARRRLNVQEVFVDVCRQIIRKDIQRRDGRGRAGREDRHATFDQESTTTSRRWGRRGRSGSRRRDSSRRRGSSRLRGSDRSCVIL